MASMASSKKAPTDAEMRKELLKFTETLHGKFELVDVISTAVERCKEMMAAKATAIYLVEVESDKGDLYLEMKDCRGYDKVLGMEEKRAYSDKKTQYSLKHFKYELIEGKKPLGLTAQIALERKPVIVKLREDFKKFEHYGSVTAKGNKKKCGKFDKDLWKKPETCNSFIGVPLIFGNEVLGVLKVESEDVQFFNEEHMEYMQLLGQMVAATINSCQFLDKNGKATKILAATRHDAEILQNIVRECAKLCRAESSSLFLYDEKLNGLIMRADHGHDFNLSNQVDYVYYKPKKKQYPMGLTYKCYDKIEPQEATTNEEVKGSEHHASKLWPHQWEDPEKPCHSIYLHPVKQEGTTPSIFGVLKVENKLKLTLEPMEIGGFTPQDKFVVKMFADAIALLLRRNHIYYGKPYTPYQMYGKPILEYLQDKDFLKSLETFAEKQQLCRCLQKFAREKQSQKSEWRTLAEYSNEVVDKAKEIASIFGCQDMANTLLSRMRDYEILLKEIPAYRHHFVHQFNVFLLGIVILSKTKKILDKFINNIDKKNILKEWFLSAMFHDIGLPIEKLNQVFQAFVKGSLNLPHNVDVQFSPFSILSIEDYYKSYYRMEKSIMGLFSDIAVQKEVGSVLHSLAFPSALGKTSHNHSLISATMVEKEFQKKNLGKDSMDRILAAIIFHEGRVAQSLYKRIECPERVKSEISLSKNPLIFLLAICDVIQNWGRPESEGEISHSSVDEFGSINLKELSFTGESKVDIHLKYDTKPSNWKHILKNVITPQLKIWRNNVKSLYITIWFEDDNTTFGNVSFNYEKDSEGGE